MRYEYYVSENKTPYHTIYIHIYIYIYIVHRLLPGYEYLPKECESVMTSRGSPDTNTETERGGCFQERRPCIVQGSQVRCRKSDTGSEN